MHLCPPPCYLNGDTYMANDPYEKEHIHDGNKFSMEHCYLSVYTFVLIFICLCKCYRQTTAGKLEIYSMDKIPLRLFAILVLVMAAPVQAMTCEQFNALGVTTNMTADQIDNTLATNEQITEYKNVIATHAADLVFMGSSPRAKALQLAKKKNRLTMLVRESLAMTRTFCRDRKNDPMKTVAIEQFDYLLDAIAKKFNQ